MVVKDNLFYLIHYRDKSFYWKAIPQKYYEGKIINQDTKAIKIAQSLLLNIDDGFLKLDSFTENSESHSVNVEGFYQNKLITESTLLGYNQTIELHLISEKFGFNKPKLFYKLKDSRDFTAVDKNKIVLNNLPSGKQFVTIYYFDGTQYRNSAKYSFKVSNPWYFSFWMLLFYLTLVTLILFLYYKWTTIRYLEKLNRKEEELKHLNQLEQLEIESANTLKMQEYEKHILEIQVQTKASEVAGKSLSIAKQAEMIESIEAILSSKNDTPQIKAKIKKVIKTNSINKNEWQAFEKNLMQSHEEFVSKLTQVYSNLTSKDIKLCIYLHMNLASKEIAPLMNISYRGVELHRYRLRKKIGILKEENLTNIMINLK